MSNSKHLAILKYNVKDWNQWRNETPDVLPDLSRADLSGGEFRREMVTVGRGWIDSDRISLSNIAGDHWADLRRADLSGVNLSKANLSWADLSNADLSESDLSEACLVGADLKRD
jgi:uncharacterized protein YjbI with pentapeptide repeats